MKNVLLSIIFSIITTFTVVHEVEHFVNEDSFSCLISHANHNLEFTDFIVTIIPLKISNFGKILQNKFIENIQLRKINNQSRAPPKLS
jgi:hypothetical protein